MLHRLLRMMACMTIVSLSLGVGVSDAIHGNMVLFDVCLIYVAFAFFVLRYDHHRMILDLETE
ncbi:hypothetical protein HF673_05570 [Acidithiobacillus thiooxidans]|uniref:Uncharacterized protein n=1 Tax=Acidithiobacillus thiooxidans ATCC 19377 TaxID=637390 RepID=A0A5P9XR11_ACITH|nr:hypothetical protein [Acidithiobacillus thiooxidans]MBU2835268.1 hypothetical protein [Acidithiobacillus thiooxidans]QFX96069.1 hypothetical protein GCD22_01785 [Acidithiobacillus thiooxidans ATCC 19377]